METEEQLRSRFVGGLRMQIQGMVNMFDSRSVAEAHQKALAWEKQGRRWCDYKFDQSDERG